MYHSSSIMFATLILLFIVRTSGQSSMASVLAAEYPSNTFMDAAEHYRLWWKYMPEKDLFGFAMEVKTTGWVAMGISLGGTMPNSDMVIGWVNGSHVVAEDRNSFGGKVRPDVDAKQNVNVTGGSEQNGWTVVKFVRARIACEPKDLTIEVGTTRVLWAFSPNNVDGPTIDYHGSSATNRGSRSINLASSGRPVSPPQTGLQSYDLLMDHAQIPSDRTSYMCQLFELPTLPTYHVVEVAPVIQANMSGIVHHYILYACPPAKNAQIATGLNNGHLAPQACSARNMNGAHECRGNVQLAAWAIGGSALRFPANTGVPLGGSSPIKYAVLEVHYDNPGYKVGLVDSSGVRMAYTRQSVSQTAGILMFGVAAWRYGQWIPPRWPGLVRNNAILPKECLAAAMDRINVTEVKLIYSFLHMHTIGKAARVRHIRNGTELPLTDSNPNYDFNFQEGIPLFNKTLKKGDALIMECDYDSSSKSNMTFGGEGTPEEMCFEFLYTVPALPLSNVNVGWNYYNYDNELKRANASGWLRIALNPNGQYDILWFNATNPDARAFYNSLFQQPIRWVDCKDDQAMRYINPNIAPIGTDSSQPFHSPTITTPYVAPNVTVQCFQGNALMVATSGTAKSTESPTTTTPVGSTNPYMTIVAILVSGVVGVITL